MEIKPTEEHLSDPYVLQLIEALSKQDDEIERLRHDIDRLTETNSELATRVVELERQHEVKDEQFTTVQETYQARVEELQGVVKRLLDATTEATLDRYARVPRFYIRELEKALQETEA